MAKGRSVRRGIPRCCFLSGFLPDEIKSPALVESRIVESSRRRWPVCLRWTDFPNTMMSVGRQYGARLPAFARWIRILRIACRVCA
jgi:hypothetical protein